mmetsp:Transcript_15523/g.32220  ORF Transcript_15523/g.32220 Transcript_15523/m.32220 type:complete len:81 (-) Transcript_15523:265-507(-)
MVCPRRTKSRYYFYVSLSSFLSACEMESTSKGTTEQNTQLAFHAKGKENTSTITIIIVETPQKLPFVTVKMMGYFPNGIP